MGLNRNISRISEVAAPARVSILAEAVLFGEGPLSGLVRAHAWDQTILGPMAAWSKELLATVNLVLASPLPSALHWGSELIMIYNDGYSSFLGSRHPAALGQPFSRVWSETWHILRPSLEATLYEGKSIYQEAFLIPIEEDGMLRDRFWTYTFSPAYERGLIKGIYNTCQNVTEGTVARRDLGVSEARSSRILESIADAVIVTDAQARVTRMNPVAERLTGWSMKAAQSRPMSEIFKVLNERARQPVENSADKVKRLGRPAESLSETILMARNGSEVHIEDSAAPIRNDKGVLIGTVLVFRDIGERRRAESDRNNMAEQLRQVLAVTTDAVASLDRLWRFSFLNEQAKRILAPSGDTLGRTVWEAFPETLAEGGPYLEHFYRAMDQGVGGEFEVFYGEPLNSWLSVSVQPAKDGVILFFRDVTEERAANAALLQQEKLAAVGRLASSLAHEINNPLESINNLLYLSANSDDVAEIHTFLQLAESELNRVAVISNQTLRSQARFLTPGRTTAEVLIESVTSAYSNRLANSGIAIEERHRAGNSIVASDEEIRQVLHHLVSNAIDAMQPGGGRLILRSRKRTNPLTKRRELVLTVADTGSGMSLATMRKIFEPFFTTKELTGAGLGLWVSLQIVQRMQGLFRVRSTQRRVRHGTVFCVILRDHVPNPLRTRRIEPGVLPFRT